MFNIKKIVSCVVIFVIALIASLTGSAMHDKQTVGGSFNPVKVDFAQGISVAGTDVISNARAITATALTVTGATSIGSASAGLKYFFPASTPAADTTLTTASTGTTVFMGTAGEDITLPAVASSAGVKFRFVVSAAFATTDMTVVSAEGDNIEGSLIVAGAVVDCDANDVITFVNDGENLGDFVELYSNGSKWFIGASGGLTASKMTCSG